VTLGRVMAAVGLVAGNLAVVRALAAGDNPELLAAVGPSGLVLQFAAWRAWRARGRGRAFAVGFLLAGGLMAASLVWAMLRPTSMGISRTGALVTSEGSPAWRAWDVYFRALQPLFDRLEPVVGTLGPGPVGSVIVPLILSLAVLAVPQLIGAGIGGLMGVLVWRRWGRDASGSTPGGVPTEG
jgi:hypothetical protein